MHWRNRPAPPGPENDGWMLSMAYYRRRSTSLVPLSPKMTTAAPWSTSGSQRPRMRAAFATRPSRKHLLFSIVGLHHLLLFLFFQQSCCYFCPCYLFLSKNFSANAQGLEVRERRHTPAENKFQIHCGGSFILTLLFQEARSLWEFPLCTARNPLNVSVDHNFFSFLLFSFPTCSQTPGKIKFWNVTVVELT